MTLIQSTPFQNKGVLKVARKESEWMNTTQLADHFGVVVMTISRWAANPELEFPRPGVINNRNYFNREECDEWMKNRTIAKTVKTVRAGG
jgi:hypothetical protein